ncbi:hypothetical protein L3Y34_008124 [Caenorhabditis briggsae]|uniref:Uncharacterized protein n=1 Tax=Caenorhabditis briggsae TaxID=6238 RepID=A0AAE9A3V4_CAEBR|nr:hypothetical protein L3Y34_008124 [Caenorhabditis briggsae]
MIRSLILLTLLVGYSTSQYAQQQRSGTVQQQPVQNVQAAQPEAIDGIPAWYQMAKPVASRVQQLPQASPSYYERIEPTYEQRRGEQPTYERPGIQTNQYANYPSYQNRQPYENLNALTSGASLSNLQASRRYPSAASGGAGGSDMPYDSALKRYHKLLLKRRQWTTKIGRILASTSPMTPSTVFPTTTTTTTQAPTTTTKKMPKSLKSIYSTIIPKTSTTTETPTEAPSTTTQATRVTGRLVGKPRGTFKPHGTRKGWRMWKKVTPKYVGKSSVTTTEVPVSSTTIPMESSTSVTSTTTSENPSTPELPLIEETEESQGTEASTSTTSTSTTTEPTTTTVETTTTEKPTTTTGSEEEHAGKGPSPLRPITVGHKWKPLRFKKPEPVDEVDTVPATSNTKTAISTRPKGLRLLEYLLPNTELLAAIKDVVAKFKASLDEAGIDQDVRLMGNQLKNTWQQLRTGLDRGVKAVRQSAESSVTHFNYGPQPLPQPQPVQIPYHHQHHHHPAVHRYTPGPMNEQIGRLFEKAVADAADQKTQQQIQQVQQQMIAPRP